MRCHCFCWHASALFAVALPSLAGCYFASQSRIVDAKAILDAVIKETHSTILGYEGETGGGAVRFASTEYYLQVSPSVLDSFVSMFEDRVYSSIGKAGARLTGEGGSRLTRDAGRKSDAGDSLTDDVRGKGAPERFKNAIVWQFLVEAKNGQSECIIEVRTCRLTDPKQGKVLFLVVSQVDVFR